MLGPKSLTQMSADWIGSDMPWISPILCCLLCWALSVILLLLFLFCFFSLGLLLGNSLLLGSDISPNISSINTTQFAGHQICYLPWFRSSPLLGNRDVLLLLLLRAGLLLGVLHHPLPGLAGALGRLLLLVSLVVISPELRWRGVVGIHEAVGTREHSPSTDLLQPASLNTTCQGVWVNISY